MAFDYKNGSIELDIQLDVKDVSGNDLAPMLMRLPKRQISQTAIKWNADVGGDSAVGESITQDATNDTLGSGLEPASLSIGDARVRETFSILTPRMAEAASAGEGELADLLKYASKSAIRNINRKVSGLLYTGDGLVAQAGVVGLSGLHKTVTSSRATSAYAGITHTAGEGGWTNYVNTAGANRALSQALMFKMSEEIMGGSTTGVDGNFTAVYTTPAIATKYKDLFQSVSDFNAIPGGLADVGYTSLSFEGRPVYIDPRCPANTMYFVDETELSLYTFKEGASAYGEEMDVNGLNYKIVQLARTNPDAIQFSVETKPQLVVSRRPAVSVLEAITQ